MSVGDGLIQQAERIAHAAMRGKGQLPDRAGFRLDLFLAKNRIELPHDLGNGKALQVELQTARQDGDGQLLGVSGRQQELHVRRRLLERLQQGVEAVRREHVHLVDKIDLVAAPGRCVLDVLQQFARVLDFGA